jgi:hypothetical protein
LTVMFLGSLLSTASAHSDHSLPVLLTFGSQMQTLSLSKDLPH